MALKTNNYITIEVFAWPNDGKYAKAIVPKMILKNHPLDTKEIDDVRVRLKDMMNRTQPTDYFEKACEEYGLDPTKYRDISMRVGEIDGYYEEGNDYRFTTSEISSPVKFNPNWGKLLEQAITEVRANIPYEHRPDMQIKHMPAGLKGKPTPYGIIVQEFPVSSEWELAEGISETSPYKHADTVLTAQGRKLCDEWSDYSVANDNIRQSAVFKQKDLYTRPMQDGSQRVINGAEMLALLKSDPKYSVSLRSDYTIAQLNNGPQHTAFQKEWNDLLNSARSPMLEFPNGDYYYVNYNHEKGQLEIGSVCNAGFTAHDAIDVDYDHDLDWNLKGLYEYFTEKNPALLDEPSEDEEIVNSRSV